MAHKDLAFCPLIGIGGYVGLFDDPNTFRRLDNCQRFVDVAVDENSNDDDFDDETRQAADLEISVDEPGFFQIKQAKNRYNTCHNHPVKKNFQGKVKASRPKETYTNTYK